MKKITTFIITALATVGLFAQTITLLDTTTTVIGAPTVELMKSTLKVENTSSTDTVRLALYRKIISEVSGSENYFCFGLLCYPPSVDTTSLITDILPNGIDSSFFADYKPKGNAGTTTIEYCFYDTSNVQEQTCVTINFVAALSGDANGNGVIDGSEICGDANNDGSIGTGELAGDIDGNGTIDAFEKLGDVDGNGIIDNGERTGDANGDKLINGAEVYGDSDNDGTPDDYMGMSDAQLNEHVNLYPNPTRGLINVSYEFGAGNKSIIISDIIGNVVYRSKLNSRSGKLNLDLSHLTNGIYFYTVQEAGKVLETKKLVLSR